MKMPCVMVTFALSKLPAPASRMVRVGASSPTSATSPGLTLAGASRASASGGSTPSVMAVAAVGARQFTRMFCLAPSSASVCISPTSAILAAP
jgi:hypothetical protein